MKNRKKKRNGETKRNRGRGGGGGGVDGETNNSKRQRRPSSPPPAARRKSKSAAEAAVENDVYEADDRTAEEELANNRRFDNVVSYEYELPSDFEDEDIDEGNVWTEEDKNTMGANPFGLDDEDGDEYSDEDEEDESDADEHDEDDEEEEEDDDDGILQAFDDIEDDDNEKSEDDEENTDASKEDFRKTLKDAFKDDVDYNKAKPRRLQDRKDVVTEVHPESQFNVDPSHYINNDRSGGLSIDDLTTAAMQGAKKMNNNEIAAKALHKNLKKILSKDKKNNKTESIPLPSNIRARFDRQVGYEKSTKDVSMWQDIIKHNREAKTIRFPKPSEFAPQPPSSVSEIIASNGTSTKSGNHGLKANGESDLEHQVQQLLREAGAVTAQDIVAGEEKELMSDAFAANGSMNAGDVRERQAKLLKMRSLMFRHELKAKRLKKIKSKEYRRKLKKAEKRKLEKQKEMNGDDALDEDDIGGIALENPEYVRELAMKAERDRAIERISLKHNNSSRWARRIIKRGVKHMGGKDMQATLGQQILIGKQKREGVNAVGQNRPLDSSDEEEDEKDSDDDISDSDEEGQDNAKNSREQLLNLLEGRDGPSDNESPPKTGLLSLPFMQKAILKKKREVDKEAKEMLALLEEAEESDSSEGEDDDDDNDDDTTIDKVRDGMRQTDRTKMNDSKEQIHAAAEDAAAADDDDDEDMRPSKKVSALAGQKSSEGGDSLIVGKGKMSNMSMPKISSGGKLKGELDEERHVSIRHNEQTTSSHPAWLFEEEKRNDTRTANALKRTPNLVEKKSKPSSREEEAATAPTNLSLPQDHEDNGNNQSFQEDHNDSDEDFVDLMKPSSSSQRPAKLSKSELQQQLVREAFAGDDVADDFAKMKKDEVDAELPEVEELNALPGWGMWSNQQKKPKWMIQKEKEQQQRRQNVANRRADKNFKNVVISEKHNRRAAKYKADQIPVQYKSKDLYESCLNTPLAPELNTSRSFKMMSRPKVIKTTGAPIPTPQSSRKFTKVTSVENQLNGVVNPLSSLSGRKGIVIKKAKAVA